MLGERWVQEEEVSSAAGPGRRKQTRPIKGTAWGGHWWFGKTVARRRQTVVIFMPQSGAEGVQHAKAGQARQNGGCERGREEDDLGEVVSKKPGDRPWICPVSRTTSLKCRPQDRWRAGGRSNAEIVVTRPGTGDWLEQVVNNTWAVHTVQPAATGTQRWGEHTHTQTHTDTHTRHKHDTTHGRLDLSDCRRDQSMALNRNGRDGGACGCVDVGGHGRRRRQQRDASTHVDGRRCWASRSRGQTHGGTAGGTAGVAFASRRDRQPAAIWRSNANRTC
jgi:hypothetical protein